MKITIVKTDQQLGELKTKTFSKKNHETTVSGISLPLNARNGRILLKHFCLMINFYINKLSNKILI